jgi:hypothetical protein
MALCSTLIMQRSQASNPTPVTITLTATHNPDTPARWLRLPVQPELELKLLLRGDFAVGPGSSRNSGFGTKV